MTTEDFAYDSGSSFLTGVAFNDTDDNNFYTPGEGLAGVTINAVHHGDDVSSYTTTWSSGGFTSAWPPASTTSPPPAALAQPLTYRNVTVGSQNVEIDFNPAAPPPAATPTPTPTPAPADPNSHACADASPTPAPTPSPTPTPTPSPTPTPTSPSGTSPATSQQTGTGSNGGVPGWPSPLEWPVTSTVNAPDSPPDPTPAGSVRGVVFFDRNGNGRRNGAGDHGLQNLTVFLDANGNGVLDAGEQSTVTLDDGSYTFTGAAPGAYQVVPQVPAGWRASTRGGAEAPVTVHDGRTTRARTFGLTQKALVAGHVFASGVGSANGAGAPVAPPATRASAAGRSTSTSTATAPPARRAAHRHRRRRVLGLPQP